MSLVRMLRTVGFVGCLCFVLYFWWDVDVFVFFDAFLWWFLRYVWWGCGTSLWNAFLKKKWRKCRKTVFFVALIIIDLQRKCKNNAEKFGFWTILYYLCSRFGKMVWCADVVRRVRACALSVCICMRSGRKDKLFSETLIKGGEEWRGCGLSRVVVPCLNVVRRKKDLNPHGVAQVWSKGVAYIRKNV